MAASKDLWRSELAAIDEDLSQHIHALANVLNELLLHVAVIHATAAGPLRSDLGQVRTVGQKTGGVLHEIQGCRNRIRQLLATP